jgi:hypothetical protein
MNRPFANAFDVGEFGDNLGVSLLRDAIKLDTAIYNVFG